MIQAIRTIARLRPLGVLAALLLSVTLTACGGDDDPSTTPNAGPSTAKPQMKCAP